MTTIISAAADRIIGQLNANHAANIAAGLGSPALDVPELVPLAKNTRSVPSARNVVRARVRVCLWIGMIRSIAWIGSCMRNQSFSWSRRKMSPRNVPAITDTDPLGHRWLVIAVSPSGATSSGRLPRQL
jgi:hypothetical protein